MKNVEQFCSSTNRPHEIAKLRKSINVFVLNPVKNVVFDGFTFLFNKKSLTLIPIGGYIGIYIYGSFSFVVV